MSIFANKDWASHTMFMAHIRYRLRNRKNMMLIKGSFIGRTSVSRRTKFNFMRLYCQLQAGVGSNLQLAQGYYGDPLVAPFVQHEGA